MLRSRCDTLGFLDGRARSQTLWRPMLGGEGPPLDAPHRSVIRLLGPKRFASWKGTRGNGVCARQSACLPRRPAVEPAQIGRRTACRRGLRAFTEEEGFHLLAIK